MLSLAHTTQELWVCLRCQHRLSNHFSLRVPPNSSWRPLQSRGLITRPVRWQEHNAPHTEKPDTPHYDGISPHAGGVEHGTLTFKPRKAGRSWRRVWLGEETVALDMNVLGQPAQIRILPDRTALPTKSTKPKVDGPDESVITNPEDFLRGMAAEAEAIDPAVVNQNIENLRTSILHSEDTKGSPTLSQCRELAQMLFDGFTKPQLLAYLKEHRADKNTMSTPDYDNFETRFYSRLCTRSAWFSGSSAFPKEAIPRLDPGIAVKKQQDFILGLEPPEGKEVQTEKQRLVERLLRDAWRLRCKEEKALQGEVDIRIQPVYLKLLLNHKNAIFKKLSEQYGAKIDVSQSQSIVRLTGDYNTCSDLSKLIYFMLEKIQVAEIQLQSLPHDDQQYKSPLSAILNNRSTLEHVGELTNTVIKTTRATQRNRVTKLQVYYIGPDVSDFEDVRRLVFQLLEPKAIGTSQIQFASEKSIIPIQVPIEVGSAVPWTEREISWTRWRDGGGSSSFKKLSKKLREVNYPTTLYDPLPSRMAAQAAAHFLVDNRSNPRVSGMHDNVNERRSTELHTISATVGHIVYPALSSRAQAIQAQARTYRSKEIQFKTIAKHFLQSIDSRRTVITGLPEVTQILDNLARSNFELEHELRIRLSSSTTDAENSVGVAPLPEIEIRIGLDNEDRKIGLKAAHFISDIRESDLLLPCEVADVRFRACTITEFTDNMDPIHRFVANSNLDVWGGKRLKTPSRVMISVPKSLCQGDGQEAVEVEYQFASMEHRSRIRMAYRGIRMDYSTIEAGKTGGRRTELQFSESYSTPNYSSTMFIPFFDTVREFIALMGRRGESEAETLLLPSLNDSVSK